MKLDMNALMKQAQQMQEQMARAQEEAANEVVEDGLPYRAASWHMWRDHRVFVPFATIQNWVEAAGEKRRRPHRERVPGSGVGRLQRLRRGRRGV